MDGTAVGGWLVQANLRQKVASLHSSATMDRVASGEAVRQKNRTNPGKDCGTNGLRTSDAAMQYPIAARC